MLSKIGIWYERIYWVICEKELKYNDSFTKTNETFKKSSADIDMLLNDDTCVTIIKENEVKEKTLELHEEEDVNEVNIVDLIDWFNLFSFHFSFLQLF